MPRFTVIPHREIVSPTLKVESWSNAARTVRVRGYTRKGSFSFDHATNADRSKATTTHSLDGVPIFLTAFTTASPVRRGELYVKIWLMTGTTEVMLLSAQYLTDHKTIRWPPGFVESSVEGPGLLRSITGTDPAAGSEVSETVPTNARWKLRAMSFRLVTDPTVATRMVQLVIDDGTNEFYRYTAIDTQAASASYLYEANPLGFLPGSIAKAIHIPLPLEVLLFQGWRIRTNTANLQSGDDFGAPQLLVEEWIEE